MQQRSGTVPGTGVLINAVRASAHVMLSLNVSRQDREHCWKSPLQSSRFAKSSLCMTILWSAALFLFPFYQGSPKGTHHFMYLQWLQVSQMRTVMSRPVWHLAKSPVGLFSFLAQAKSRCLRKECKSITSILPNDVQKHIAVHPLYSV